MRVACMYGTNTSRLLDWNDKNKRLCALVCLHLYCFYTLLNVKVRLTTPRSPVRASNRQKSCLLARGYFEISSRDVTTKISRFCASIDGAKYSRLIIHRPQKMSSLTLRVFWLKHENVKFWQLSNINLNSNYSRLNYFNKTSENSFTSNPPNRLLYCVFFY